MPSSCGGTHCTASIPLLQALCAAADVDAKATRAAELRKAQRRALLAALTAWPLDITGHEGYMKVFSAHVLMQHPAASSSCSADSASGCENCVLRDAPVARLCCVPRCRLRSQAGASH